MTNTSSQVKLEALRDTLDFLDNWQELKGSKSLEKTFFHLLIQEKRTAAKKVLERIKEKSVLSPWRKGYITALEGMALVPEGSEDRSILINHIQLERIGELRKVFLQHSKNELLPDFDKGFFSAWVDYLQTLKPLIQASLN